MSELKPMLQPAGPLPAADVDLGYMLFRATDGNLLQHTIRLPIVSITISKGGFVVTATTRGPFDPMRGVPVIYGPDGVMFGEPLQEAVIPKVNRGDFLTFSQALNPVTFEWPS